MFKGQDKGKGSYREWKGTYNKVEEETRRIKGKHGVTEECTAVSRTKKNIWTDLMAWWGQQAMAAHWGINGEMGSGDWCEGKERERAVARQRLYAWEKVFFLKNNNNKWLGENDEFRSAGPCDLYPLLFKELVKYIDRATITYYFWDAMKHTKDSCRKLENSFWMTLVITDVFLFQIARKILQHIIKQST